MEPSVDLALNLVIQAEAGLSEEALVEAASRQKEAMEIEEAKEEAAPWAVSSAAQQLAVQWLRAQ